MTRTIKTIAFVLIAGLIASCGGPQGEKGSGGRSSGSNDYQRRCYPPG